MKIFMIKGFAVLSLSAILAISVLTFNLCAATEEDRIHGISGFLPKLENFKGKIVKETNEINNALKSTESLTEEFKAGSVEMREALEKAKNNPGLVAKSKLRLKHAMVMGNIAASMDDILLEEDRINDAFGKIDFEFANLILQVDGYKGETKEKLEITKEELERLRKKATQLARKYQNSQQKEELREKLSDLRDEILLLMYELENYGVLMMRNQKKEFHCLSLIRLGRVNLSI